MKSRLTVVSCEAKKEVSTLQQMHVSILQEQTLLK